jgi:hypothetical protein
MPAKLPTGRSPVTEADPDRPGSPGRLAYRVDREGPSSGPNLPFAAPDSQPAAATSREPRARGWHLDELGEAAL